MIILEGTGSIVTKNQGTGNMRRGKGSHEGSYQYIGSRQDEKEPHPGGESTR